MAQPRIEPGLRGPYQLIEHARGHLLQGNDDVDRILPLIGFDQALEVCLDVFINLHLRLRGKVEVTREESDKALRNFHTKLEFLERYVVAQQLAVDVPGNQIVWFHNLRNELYHSGNGMVPELHMLEGAQAAAITVFKALFGVDISESLGLDTANVVAAAREITAVWADSRKDLIRVMQDAENYLRHVMDELNEPVDEPASLVSLLDPAERSSGKSFFAKVKDQILRILETRNRVAHGAEVREAEANKAIESLQRLLNSLSDFGLRQTTQIEWLGTGCGQWV
jgi:hypothetical protein